tara:strand:+ start:880 stop:1116 length:237 start_codon:yes stop_codon:yes gene_type:complete
MEIKHTQARNLVTILEWLLKTAPFPYKITTHQNGELHVKIEVPTEKYYNVRRNEERLREQRDEQIKKYKKEQSEENND